MFLVKIQYIPIMEMMTFGNGVPFAVLIITSIIGIVLKHDLRTRLLYLDTTVLQQAYQAHPEQRL